MKNGFAGVQRGIAGLAKWCVLIFMLLPGADLTAQLLITEIQSNQAASGAGDYWELTNVGSNAVDLSGWKWDDDSRDPADAAAVNVPDGTVIAAGESIVFTGISPAAFRTWWGVSESVQVISTGSAPGLGKNDSISLFSNSVEVAYLSYVAGGFVRTDGSSASGDHAGVSAGGAATVALVLDPSFGTDPAGCRYTAAVAGMFGAFASAASSSDVGSPGVVNSASGSAVSSVDLSAYVRVGRYDLPEPTRTTPPNNTNLLCQEASGVTYNWDTDTLFIIGDGARSVTQVSKTGGLIDTMTLALGSSPQGTEFYDTEGITYIGNGEFVFVEERDRQLVKFAYTAGSVLTREDTQAVDLGTFSPNQGIEGFSYDPQTAGFICVKEIAPIQVFQTTADFDAGTAGNGSSTNEISADLFAPALLGVSDLADVFALSCLPGLTNQPDSTHLLILSQENAKILNVDRAGTVYSALNITVDLGDTLDAASMQHEGLTMDRDGNLYVVNENGGGDIDHPQLWVYAPSSASNQAPAALIVTNATASLAENSSTLMDIKMADLFIVDDGLGDNVLSVSGEDAGDFHIAGTVLYLNAGTGLDYETKTSYTVTLSVDDSSVGSTPDATNIFTLVVADVADETGGGAALIISEVAPWSSGNSQVGADWFEISNPGTNSADISGWKVDDSSASFTLAVLLNGITNIAPGESVIFIEGSALATVKSNFLATWFGPNIPAGLQIGTYSGSGVSLSTGGDGVNLFDAGGINRASISFGASSAGSRYQTFDNAVGLNGASVSRLSAARVCGGFYAVGDYTEIGSPGTIGGLIITEVTPWASGSSPVGADWFEVVNTSPNAIDITGWKVDDSSKLFTSAVWLNGITSIASGEAVIFIETADLPSARAAFLTNWFGANTPSGLQIGSYSGSGIGLSTGGDGVNLFDSTGTRRSGITFGASPAVPPYATFDNTFGLNNTVISELSDRAVHGAFTAVNSTNEIGSPGNLNKVVVSEVAPWSSGSSPAGADWFELSNVGSAPVDITGWKMDDSSQSPAGAVLLTGITSIAPGESVIFIEAADLNTAKTNFLAIWFGQNPPATLQVGAYSGSGVGLGSGGDQVNIYDGNSLLQASVAFGASPSGPYATFENSSGQNSVNPVLTQLSEARLNGAFSAVNSSAETGSPGVVRVPGLNLIFTGGGAVVHWSVDTVGFRLETATSLDGNWTNVTQGALLTNGVLSVTVPAAGGTGFFRLSRPR